MISIVVSHYEIIMHTCDAQVSNERELSSRQFDPDLAWPDGFSGSAEKNEILYDSHSVECDRRGKHQHVYASSA